MFPSQKIAVTTFMLKEMSYFLKVIPVWITVQVVIYYV